MQAPQASQGVRGEKRWPDTLGLYAGSAGDKAKNYSLKENVVLLQSALLSAGEWDQENNLKDDADAFPNGDLNFGKSKRPVRSTVS